MTALGRLLEVLHDSRDSWSTLRAEYRVWTHRERSSLAWRAGAEEQGAMLYATATGVGEPEPDESEETWRIWIAKPDRMRQETREGPGGPQTTVVVGDRWWSWDEHWGAQTNDGEANVGTGGVRYPAWIEPARVLGLLRFEALGTGSYAGMPTLRAMARRRLKTALDRDNDDWDLHELGSGAEEYRFNVDADRGVLLRIEARFQDEPFLIGEVVDIAFDEGFEPETFILEPPEGEEIHSVEERFAPGLDRTIEEAAAEAPFPVFILPAIPDEWKLSVSSFPPSKRPATPHCVHVDYRSEDGTAALSISQVPDGESDFHVLLLHVDDESPGFEEVERDGLNMLVRGRSDDWSETQVHLSREGTELTLTSRELSGPRVIELAARLVPARTTPPDL
jgi:hypothetical protein